MDYYIQFSEVIDNVTSEELEWFNKEVHPPYREENWDDEKIQTWMQERRIVDLDDIEYYPSFDFKVTTKWDVPTNIWIFSDDSCSGNVDHVAELMQRFLRKFRPDDCFYLGWCCYCSRPAVGEAGGGAIFVTADGIKSVSSFGMIDEWRRDHEKKYTKNKK
jgi:hypothetical protein